MGWTRQSGRVARGRRRPCLESLETRQLLSHVSPKPAASSDLNSDGSTNYDQIIGASAARSEFNVDGTGETVAVIDTGADFNNAALGGAVGAGDKIVAGVDFTGSPNGILPTWQHGTGTAGIVAGNGGGYTGVAPGADIVALRVFGDNNEGSFAEIDDALEWVITNHAEYNITAVNLSVSDGGNYTSNLFANAGVGQQITQAISQLDSLNIPVVIAAGNSFDGKTQGLGFPAIVPDAISVTATDANDQLASTAQRLGTAEGGSSAVKIAAPGVNIDAPSGDSGTSEETGTSFATPQVTGSIMLLQEMYENAYHTLPTIAELDQLLQQGAVPVYDSATGITVGRLDVLNSATILNKQIQASQASTSSSGSTTTNSGSSGSTSTTTSSGSTTTPPVSSGSTSNGTDTSTTTSSSTDSSTTTSSSTDSSTTTSSSTSSDGSTSTSDSSSTTPPASSPPATAAPTDPLTQVFVNGVSIGDYSTAQLAAEYPGLFAFLTGPVTSLNIWAPPGSNVDLGPAASSTSPTPASTTSPTVKKSDNVVKMGSEQEHAIAISKAVPVVHHAAAAKKTNSISSFFSSLFHI
jgi:subtilisin family serine protease